MILTIGLPEWACQWIIAVLPNDTFSIITDSETALARICSQDDRILVILLGDMIDKLDVLTFIYSIKDATAANRIPIIYLSNNLQNCQQVQLPSVYAVLSINSGLFALPYIINMAREEYQ